MKATLYFALAGSGFSAVAVRVMRELLEENGPNAFELQLICIDDNVDTVINSDPLTVPYLIIMDEHRQESPIVGDFNAQKELIGRLLHLTRRPTT